MNTVVEVSMYPLRDEYLPAIDAFLAAVNARKDIEVKTNRMSTQLFGDHGTVMDLLSEATRQAYERFGSAVFVIKIIPGAPRTVGGYE